MSSTLRILAVAVMATVVGISAQARAARTLWLDAAAPGANPGTTWEDLSPSGYDFANMGATHNAGTMSYHFVGDDEDIMVGIGDESLYDFETEKAGAGLGTPFRSPWLGAACGVLLFGAMVALAIVNLFTDGLPVD